MTFRADALSACAPDPILTVDEWADLYRLLSSAESGNHGQWRNDRTPYLVEPMRLLSVWDPTPRVVLCFPAQDGKSEVGINWVGYVADCAPAPVMVLRPTIDDCEGYSKTRLKHLAALPRLVGKFSDPRSRDSGNTLGLKEFPGGHLILAGANAPSRLASWPIRFLHADEPDRYPPSAGTEGDPLQLARARMTSFGNRAKELMTATPTNPLGRIWLAYLASSRATWHVPCPSCGEHFAPEWPMVKWAGTPQEPETFRVWLECPCCKAAIEEHNRGAMLAGGKWVHAEPGRPVKGYRKNAITARLGAIGWRTLVDEFLAATSRAKVGDLDGLRVFVNTRLAEPFEDLGERVEPDTLRARVEPHWERLPIGVRALTAGVDTHDDRLEVSVYGWGLGMESWLVAHFNIPTDPIAGETWQALDAALLTPTWERADGAHLRVTSVCIDAGGHRTQNVLEYATDKRRSRIVAAIIGAKVPGAPIWKAKAGKSAKVKGAKFWLVGRHESSEAIAKHMRITQPGPLYLHVQEGTPDHWFAEMAAQKRTETTIRSGRDRGRKAWQWEPITAGVDDHAWDCARYALAALHRMIAMGFKMPSAPQPVAEAVEPPRLGKSSPIMAPAVDKPPASVQPIAARPIAPKRRGRWGWNS